VFLRVFFDPLVGTFLITHFIRIIIKENVQQLPFVATTIKHSIQKHGRFTFVFGNPFDIHRNVRLAVRTHAGRRRSPFQSGGKVEKHNALGQERKKQEKITSIFLRGGCSGAYAERTFFMAMPISWPENLLLTP
jgi:hypothetical protein